MAKCDNCGENVGFRQQLKVTHALARIKKIPWRQVFCSVECALEFEAKKNE